MDPSCRRFWFYLSFGEAFIDQAAPLYQKPLGQSGYQYTPQYASTKTGQIKSRPRNDIPPFTKSVSSNNGQRFLSLVNNCFPERRQARKYIQPKHAHYILDTTAWTTWDRSLITTISVYWNYVTTATQPWLTITTRTTVDKKTHAHSTDQTIETEPTLKI